ncbi:MAG: polysaccharide deacetylase family protein [Desulfuromusa sp.]|nr:polysaccharide deacetylase family protein [Desulfuromusa sp.]
MKYLILCVFYFLTFLVTTSSAAQVNAFIYHRFDENRYPSTNISADIFTQQLEYLKNSNIEVVSLGAVATRLKDKQQLPDHAASISIDDAFRSFYDVCMPIIRRYGFPVTLFVNTDSVGTSGYLNWDEIKELAAEGVEIGNHTASHAYLVEMEPAETYSQWQERITGDIERAQKHFEDHLGFRPDIFAYPFGEYSPTVIDIVQGLGFKAAFAQQSGVIYSGSNRFILPRFPMGGPFATVDGFKSKFSMQPLQVFAQTPIDPVIQNNPPVLSFQLQGQGKIDPQQFNCFVQGENRCWVETDESDGYKIVAEQPLTGRRNKYTLTLQTRQGDWLWYSHLWINAKKKAQYQE